MHQPAKKKDPEKSGETKLNDRHEQPSLNQLPEPGNEEAAERCDYISG